MARRSAGQRDGAGGHKRTLQDALAAAYSTNPTLLAARAQLRADGRKRAAGAGRLAADVVVSGAGRLRRRHHSTSVATGSSHRSAATTATSSRAQATVTQPLYRGGATRAGTNQAENQVMRAARPADRARAAGLQRHGERLSSTSSSTQQLLQLNINNEQVLARQLQATNDRFRVGEITRTDVAQAEAALAGAQRARGRPAEGNLQTARATYQQLRRRAAAAS